MTNSEFMKYAINASKYSNDPSTKVGSVIIIDKIVFSVGWNRFPEGVTETEERWNDRRQKYPRVIHAEADALITGAKMSCRYESFSGFHNSVIYTTEFPCCSCCGLIIQHGIKRVVTQDFNSGYANRWAKEIEISKSMFNEAGVILEIISR